MMIPDGVWLDLSLPLYLEDEALGSSDLKLILANCSQWHAKKRNPVWRALNPPSEDETFASIFGSALHCMVLEPDAFEARYFVQEPKPALPKTKEEINETLVAMGRPALSLSKLKVHFEAAAMLAGVRLMSDWEDEQDIICAERTALSARVFGSLTLLRSVIDRHSEAMKWLSGGRAEVSVFWTDEHGTRLKARFDYLKKRRVSDIKSYAMRETIEPIESFCMTSDRFAYDLSAAHYMDCRCNALPALAEAGKVYVGAPEPGENGAGLYAIPAPARDVAFFQAVARERDPIWAWIACATGGFPEVDVIELPTTLNAYGAAVVQMDQARAIYRQMVARFAPGEPWIVDRGHIVLNDYCLTNSRARDRGMVRYDTA